MQDTAASHGLSSRPLIQFRCFVNHLLNLKFVVFPFTTISRLKPKTTVSEQDTLVNVKVKFDDGHVGMDENCIVIVPFFDRVTVMKNRHASMLYSKVL